MHNAKTLPYLKSAKTDEETMVVKAWFIDNADSGTLQDELCFRL